MPKRTLEADFLKASGVEPRVGEPGVDITRRIYLVGFMGCGKSTFGAALAKRLRWQFVGARAVSACGMIELPWISMARRSLT